MKGSWEMPCPGLGTLEGLRESWRFTKLQFSLVRIGRGSQALIARWALVSESKNLICRWGGKLRHREVKQLAQGHTASRSQSQD